MRDTALVYLDQRRLPEVVTLVLAERGQQRVSGEAAHVSQLSWTTWQLKWKVVNLWEVPAEQLLALGDVRLIPWVLVSRVQVGTEESILRVSVRRRIDTDKPLTGNKEQGDLLAVTQDSGTFPFQL